jgi:hypothetical protein
MPPEAAPSHSNDSETRSAGRGRFPILQPFRAKSVSQMRCRIGHSQQARHRYPEATSAVLSDWYG